MSTNGMSETNSSEVLLKDVSPEAFRGMLDFMYSGELDLEATTESGALLLQLFLLADQFGVILLHQECCKTLLEWLSEDTVCPILQVVSSDRSCKLIEETCERNFSAHFDYCTTASIDFVSLDETSFSNIILHPELTVTSEEKVLDAIFMWGMKAKELCGWEVVDELMTLSTPEVLFGKRLQSVHDFLSFVRFPIVPFALLKKLEKSNISRHIPTFEYLVTEAIGFIESGLTGMYAKHRRSSYKELQYICDGDSNGVLYFAGTSCGEHQWVNPVLAQETSFAGPRIENGHSSSWWMVDTGSNRQLMCNYYTLRQDGSRAYFRYWSLQGSLDGKTCTNLSLHENDRTVCKPGQFASWPIVGPNALRPLGPTADASNFSNLCICFLELYGYFH